MTAWNRPWSSGGTRICSTSSGSSPPHPDAAASSSKTTARAPDAVTRARSKAQRHGPSSPTTLGDPSPLTAKAIAGAEHHSRARAHHPRHPAPAGLGGAGGGRKRPIEAGHGRARRHVTERDRIADDAPVRQWDIAHRERPAARCPLQHADQQTLRLRRACERGDAVDGRRSVRLDRRLEPCRIARDGDGRGPAFEPVCRHRDEVLAQRDAGRRRRARPVDVDDGIRRNLEQRSARGS